MYYASNNGDGSGEIQYKGKRSPSYDDGWCTGFNGCEVDPERIGNANYVIGYTIGCEARVKYNADQ